MTKEYLTKESYNIGASWVAQTVKNLPAVQETWVQSLFKKIPWRRKWQPTTVFLPGQLAGHSPWGRKESNTAERLTLSYDIANLDI